MTSSSAKKKWLDESGRGNLRIISALVIKGLAVNANSCGQAQLPHVMEQIGGADLDLSIE